MEHSICLLDANVQTLLDIQVHPLVRTINLHGNVIRRIQNLSSLHNLRHLDLSANRITAIEGLESLLMLRTLNLSYNFIQNVDGLKSLRCLVSINLSYNRISDLNGFREIGGPKYQLQQISLHGNCIQSTTHVIQCLRACTTLCELVLKHENSGNPLCDTPGYRQTILNGLPWLRVLDGCDRSGRSVPLCEEAMQGPIVDIDPYLDYLVPTSDAKVDGPNLLNNNDSLSPKLEDSLDRYCLRNISQNSTNHSPLIEEEDVEISPKDVHNFHDLEFRPASAGRRTASLKRNRHLSRSSPALESVRDGFSATSTRLTVSTVMDYSTIQRYDHIPSVQRHPMMSKTSESTQSSSSSSDEKNQQPTRRSTPNLRMKRRVSRRDVAYESDSTTDLTEGGENYRISRSSLPRSIRQRRKNSKGSKRNFRSTSAIPHEPNDSSDNPGQEAAIQRALISPHHLNRKDEDPTTILICRKFSQSLMKELDVERELRWRAEQTANKLSEQIQQLHNYRGYSFNEQNLQETALVVTDRLKQALMHERDVRARLQTDFDMIKDKNKELSQRLQEAEAVEEDLRHTQRAMETSVTKLEAEKMKHHSQQARLAQEAQLKASALAQEVEHLKTSIRALKAQVHQLQNLLAAREQEHRQEMESRLSSGKKDIQEAVAKEIGKEKSRYDMELNQQQERVEQLQRKYLELEDEFQVAIHVEVTRYKELTAVYLQLQEAYVAVSEELAKRKQSTVAAHDKERESAAVMMELTAMVKEQKTKITELVKSKQDSEINVKSLETQVQDFQRCNMMIDVLNKEKSKLESQVLAQEAIIESLKSEKKSRNYDGNHQGIHDRSKAEARIEEFEIEISILKKQAEREADAIRLKNKLIDDQVETIRKLKESLQDKEKEIVQAKDTVGEEQRATEDQLAVQIAINHELQQAVESISKRKDELKQQLTEQQMQVNEYKKEQNSMSTKWKEKAEMISRLEVQVRQMKESWEAKEHKLQEERDRAIQSARVAMEKLCKRDETFYKELEEQRKKYEEKLGNVVSDKHQELSRAYQKVEKAEEDMRRVLQETAVMKKAMDEKVHKLTGALSEMQQNLVIRRARINAGTP